MRECADTVTMAVLGAMGMSFQGFYQKKPPLEVVLAAELITRAGGVGCNAKA